MPDVGSLKFFATSGCTLKSYPACGLTIKSNKILSLFLLSGFQARSKDQEILEEGGGAGPSSLPRRDHE